MDGRGGGYMRGGGAGTGGMGRGMNMGMGMGMGMGRGGGGGGGGRDFRPGPRDHGGGFGFGGNRGGYGRGRGGGGGGGYGGPPPRHSNARFGQNNFRQRQHVSGLTDDLLALFRPRPPLEFKAPLKKPTPKLPLTGLASYVKFFAENDKPEPPKKLPDRKERKVIAKKAKAEKGARKLKEAIAKYDPKSIQGATKDPYHTLFVSRIDKVATEDNLRDAFGRYGKIEEIKLIKDPKGKSKGYAFIEYSSSREMKDAYKDADNMKILSRRVCVDVERGRTVDGWKPRRLGGGRGGEAAKQKKNASKNSAGRFGGGVSSHYQSDYRGDRRGGGGGSFRDRGWGASGDRPRYQDDRGGRGGRGGPGLGYRGDRDRSRDFERDRYNGSRGGGGDRYRERDRGDRYRDDEDRYRGGGRERKRGWDGDEGRGGGGDHGDRKRYSERSDHHRYRDRSPHERSYKRSRYAREEGEL